MELVVAGAEDRHLNAPGEQCRHPEVAGNALLRAHRGPPGKHLAGLFAGLFARQYGHRFATSGTPSITGTGCSRSVRKEIVGSGVSGAFTNEVNRASFSGSSSTPRHSSR
ncbi:hypothetical protein HQ32_03636 [Prauserella sp. Am3]|nr:hypothetical protein HQ32_03636 [Prauserella sp. Am3]